MPSKLFINNTGYQINGNLTVRAGSEPSNQLNSVQFVLDPTIGSQLMVYYGDDSNPFVDGLETAGLINGGSIILNQTVVSRAGEMDDMFNCNDTITVALADQCFVIAGSNTWT